MTFGSRRKVEQQEQPQIEQVIVEGGDEISLETLGNLVQLQVNFIICRTRKNSEILWYKETMKI